MLDPWVTAQFLGILGYTLTGEAVLKGRSLFADRLGEEVAVTAPHAGRRPHRRPGVHRHRHRRRGPGHPPQRAHRGRRAAAVRAQRLHRPARRARRPPARPCAAASSPRPASAAGHVAAARHREPGRADRPASATACSCQDVAGLHSGVNPVSGDFSTGAEGLRIRGGELAEPVREFTIASTLQRMLKDVVAVGNDLEWLPDERGRASASSSTTSPCPGVVSRLSDGATLRRPSARADRRPRGREPGEQVEVYRRPAASTTSVKAYDGEVESLTSAESSGVGIRVIRDHRQGFAHAGTLDEDVIARDARRGPRQRRVRRAGRVFGLAEPDGVAAGRPGPVARRRSSPSPPSARSSWPSTSSGRCIGRDPRVTGVRTASYGDSPGEAAIAVDRRHRGAAGRGTSCACRCSALAERRRRDQDRRRHRRRPRARRRSTSSGRPPTRSTGPPACSGPRQPPSQRLADRARAPAGGDPPRHRRRHAHRRAGAQGPLAVRRPGRRADRLAAAHAASTIRPTRVARRPSATTARAWPAAATR